MASNRSALVNATTGESKIQNTKNALSGLGGKPKGSKFRFRNETYMEKLENAVSLSSKRKIESILSDVNNLGDVEKMLLYLRLPTGFSESEASTFTKSSPSGPNSTREEHTKAFNWICTHLEESPDTSMRKSDVYEDYKVYCDSFKITPVCAADFGKIMKGVFPKMKRRRLGTRGNSRYCYSGIRKKADMKSPVLPQLDLSSSIPKTPCQLCPDHHMLTAAAGVLCSWERKSHSKEFSDIVQWAQYLIQEGHVPKESEPAKAFISTLEDSGGKTPKLSHLDQEAWLQRSPEERRRETTHQLQLKLQQKQFVKDQQRKEEEERRKSFGVQATESSIDAIDSEAVVSRSKETLETTTEMTQSTCVAGSTMTSPKPSGPNGIVSNAKEKESPKKKLTPIQPKNPRGNVCLIPVPFPPTDNQPLKLVYLPSTGKKLAIPANMNLPGSQPLPGSPMVSSQVCQNTVTIKNKVIVPVSQIQLQASQIKATPAPAITCSNGQQVLDQHRTTISIQGSKVNPVTAPSTTLMAVNNQWSAQPKVNINPGILSVLPANQVGLVQSIIPADSVKGISRASNLVTSATVQGIRNAQKRTLIVPGNKIISVPQTDAASPPENSLNSGNVVRSDMMLIPNTLSNNIPATPLELVISQSNQGEQSQQKYLLSNTTVSSMPAENQQQSLTTSVADLEAILAQRVSSQKAVSLVEPTTSIQTKRLNPTKPVLTRGNSLPSSSVTVTASTTASPQATSDVIHPSASNLLRSLTQITQLRNDAVSASVKSGHQALTKEQQPQQLAAKDGKPSRLLEELLRPTPAKLLKASVARKNPQPRPKSVAGMLEDKLNSQGVKGANSQAVDASSLYPSLSIHKKMNKMQTVSGMSAAMMLPPEFRGKLEQAPEDRGDTAVQQASNQLQVAFSPQGGLTLITQEGSAPGSPKIFMQIPPSSQSQLLSMAIPSSPQVAVGSPASNSGQLSAPSTPLANLGSPEALTSRSSNNTPMSDMGSVPASPAQPQQAQVFFVPINQGQGLDPDLISVNNKSPVKPKHRQVFFANNNPVTTMVEAPLDLSGMHENVAAIQQQNASIDGSNSALFPTHLNRKRHHSGGILMTRKASSQDLTRSPVQQHTVNKSFVNMPANLNMITNMPPPSRLPQMGLHLNKGKPTPGSRVGARGNTGYRKRNVSGPSISLQTGQQQVSIRQSDQINIPVGATGTSVSRNSERERSLAKRSQSVPLPELSESLQNFIISTKIGEEMTASGPEEIEKNLRTFEPVTRRAGMASLNQFGAKRNLSTQLQSMMHSDVDNRERSNEAMLNEFLNDLTDSRDENENPTTSGPTTTTTTTQHHLIGSTGSSNCASSQTEVTANQSGGIAPQWSGLEQTLAQAQPAMSLVDSVSSTDLELQNYTLESFIHSGNSSMPDFTGTEPFTTSVTM